MKWILRRYGVYKLGRRKFKREKSEQDDDSKTVFGTWRLQDVPFSSRSHRVHAPS